MGEIFGEGTGPATALLRSPTVIILSIGLWGMNVYLFRKFGIDYVYVLTHDLVKERRDRESRDRRRSRGGCGGQSSSGGGDEKGERSPPHSVEGIRGGEMDRIGGVLSTRATKDLERMENLSDAGDDPPRETSCCQVVGGPKEVVIDISASGPALTAADGRVVKPRAGGAIVQTAAGRQAREQGGAGGAGLSYSPSKFSAGMNAGSDSEVTTSRLFGLSSGLLLALHATNYTYMYLWGGSTMGAIFAYYVVVMVVLALPLSSTRWVRSATGIILHRVLELINPRCSSLAGEAPRPIPFIDVFFADAMCSLSKVFFDWGMLWHLASHYPDPVPPSFHAIVIPSVCASLPYIIRARQCLIMREVGRLKNDPKRYQHTLNAIKYSTSLFPLIVSATLKTDLGLRYAEDLEILLIALMVVNSLYSFVWDVLMDWGMMQNPRAVLERTLTPCSLELPAASVITPHGDPEPRQAQQHCVHAVMRPRLRFGWRTSLLVLITDANLRFFWTMRFVQARVFPNVDAFILTTEFLEVFRRSVWNLLRVEWEKIKQDRAAGVRPAEEAEGDARIEVTEENVPFLTSVSIDRSP